MQLFDVALVLATLLCSLVAGFLFAFAVVIMPGIGKLSDAGFLRAFQEMDGVIQNNQPIFMIVWAGSVVALIAAAVLGFGELDGSDQILLVGATVVYLLGVQLPTALVNVPLNNELQKLDVAASSGPELGDARSAFEPRWNRWNRIRTALSCLVSAMLILLLIQL